MQVVRDVQQLDDLEEDLLGREPCRIDQEDLIGPGIQGPQQAGLP
ncbi:hypothetical protein ACWEV3_20320 [Saccharopolyspora sp. NPDC003752]